LLIVFSKGGWQGATMFRKGTKKHMGAIHCAMPTHGGKLLWDLIMGHL